MTTMNMLSKQEINLSQTDSIDQIHIHPSYNNDSHGFDIALLRLIITILYVICHVLWTIFLHCSPDLFIRHQSQINNQWLSREMIELNSNMRSSVMFCSGWKWCQIWSQVHNISHQCFRLKPQCYFRGDMAGVLAYKRGGVLRRNQSYGNLFSPSIRIIFSMFGVDLDILDIDWSGDRMGEDRRRVQKIFCSQTSRAGGDHCIDYHH